MPEYVVLARKYRPGSFETLIGQDNIAKTLKNSILRGQLAHAYLFCGPRGVGKTSTARIFAKAINCEHPSADLEPCGECESCQSFDEGRSYCIHEMDAASNNGVEDIKTLMDQVQIPPQVGRYSVYIIDEVHMLSTSAFNAFLKTLEEPPSHAIFILCTTEKHKVIPTILSRCQTYDFNRISVSDIVKNLRGIARRENVTVDDESLHVIARKADGAMRDALTIFDQTVAFCGTDIKYEDVIRNLNVLDYEYSFRMVDAALKGDYATELIAFDEILSKGFNAQYFISALGEHLRDLLVSRTGGMEGLLDFPESLRQRYCEQASRCSVKFIYDALAVTTSCEAGYKSSVNQRLHIEFALMRLAFLNAAPSESKVPGAEAAKPVEKHVTVPENAVSAAVLPKKEAESVEPAAVLPKKDAPSPMKGLSLGALIEEKTEQMKEKSSGDEPVPTDELLCAKWPEMVAMHSNQPRLTCTLNSAKLSFSEEEGRKVLCFEVVNEAQKEWLETNLLHKLEEEMMTLAGTSKLRLCISVAPEGEQRKTIYLPQDKIKKTMEDDAQARDMVKEFKLDVK